MAEGHYDTEVTIDTSRVDAMLDRLEKKTGDMKPAMVEIGEIILKSIQLNFEKQGRPAKWAALAESTKKNRKKKKKWPGKILKVSGSYGLVGSIKYKADKGGVAIGTNRVYAPTHQFGAKKGEFGVVTANVKAHTRRMRVKTKSKKAKHGTKTKKVQVSAHTKKMAVPWGDIPARPFMAVQDSDWPGIEAVIEKYLLEGAK